MVQVVSPFGENLGGRGIFRHFLVDKHSESV
jgi:hypothetical protein